MKTVTRSINTEAEMEALGMALVGRINMEHLMIYLRGPLGAGKTTMVRGILRALGYRGAVKSPTFTLVEPYTFGSFTLYHFDLYRLKDPEELEFIGIRDYLRGDDTCVVEWPELGGNLLPAPDLDVMIEPVNRGRSVVLTGHNQYGAAILAGLES